MPMTRQVKALVVTDAQGNEKMVTACDVEGCWKAATQFHGTLESPVYTCDEHAEQVTMQMLQVILGW